MNEAIPQDAMRNETLERLPTAGLTRLVQTLKAARDAPLGSLEAMLAARLQRSAMEFTEELKEEYARGNQALEALRLLADSPYFSQRAAVLRLQEEIAGAGRELRWMVEELLELVPTDWIEGPGRLQDTKVCESASEEDSGGPLSKADADVDASQYDQVESSGFQSRAAGRIASGVGPDEMPPASPHSSAEEMADCGDACLGEGDADKAIVWYSESLRLRPYDAQTLRSRGRAFLQVSEFQAAIDDFSAVLRFHPEDAESRLRRADAMALFGKPEAAIADYRILLRACPEALSARHNLGVAFLMLNRFQDAIGAFDIVLSAHPNSANTLAKRGCAHSAVGNHESAAADLRLAAKFSPNDSRIQSRLAEAERMLEQTSPTASAEAAARSTRKPPRKTQLEVKRESITLADEASPSPSGPRDTQPEIRNASQTRPEAVQGVPPLKPEAAPTQTIRVVCPDCRAVGSVRWDKLGKLLTCKGCGRFYRVNPDGSMAHVIQDKKGKWKELEPGPSWVERLALHRKAVIGVAMAALLLAVYFKSAYPVPAQSTEVALPLDLNERAEMMAKAWARKDLPLMRRLTLSSLERGMFSWLRRHPPPNFGLSSLDEMQALTCEVRTRHRTDTHADLVVRLRNPLAALSKEAEFVQRWEERDGIWFFIPGR
ncbi:MAG: tetratricopeptide repeat protein [Gemmataceae bacterium]|nr:tetratricopeptide repeat protein [Gemmataceae bacterium]